MRYVWCIIAFLIAGYTSAAQPRDLFPEYKLFNKYTAKFGLDDVPNIPADTDMIAIWNMEEDVDRHNYFVVERYDRCNFVFTYMNREGQNRTYEHVTMYFSKIANTDFLNVLYYDHENEQQLAFFLKVTDMDKRRWRMNLSLVTDTTLMNLPNPQALRERIAQNLNNPTYFQKPVHFHKKLPLMYWYCK